MLALMTTFENKVNSTRSGHDGFGAGLSVTG
jgi:hypothetical protein